MNHVHFHVVPKPSLEQGMIFKIEDYPHKVERPKEELLKVCVLAIPNILLAISRIVDTGKDESRSCLIVNTQLRTGINADARFSINFPQNFNTVKERATRCKIINSTKNNIVKRGKYVMDHQLFEQRSFAEQEACY